MPPVFANEFIRQGILFDNELNRPLAFRSEAGMAVADILKKLKEVSGLTQKDFAKKVGVSQGTISKWINEGHSPNLDQWERVVRFGNHFPSVRGMFKGAALTTGVPIMGYIGAGAEIIPEFEQVPPDGLEQVDLPFAVSTDLIAFRVKGDSMLPAYRDGDVVLVWADQRGKPNKYFGQEVAVRTEDGQRYIKEIQPGQRADRFNLHSHNSKMIPDARLQWIGEIYLTIKNNQVRKSAVPKVKSKAHA